MTMGPTQQKLQKDGKDTSPMPIVQKSINDAQMILDIIFFIIIVLPDMFYHSLSYLTRLSLIRSCH